MSAVPGIPDRDLRDAVRPSYPEAVPGVVIVDLQPITIYPGIVVRAGFQPCL